MSHFTIVIHCLCCSSSDGSHRKMMGSHLWSSQWTWIKAGQTFKKEWYGSGHNWTPLNVIWTYWWTYWWNIDEILWMWSFGALIFIHILTIPAHRFWPPISGYTIGKPCQKSHSHTTRGRRLIVGTTWGTNHRPWRLVELFAMERVKSRAKTLGRWLISAFELPGSYTCFPEARWDYSTEVLESTGAVSRVT